MDRHRYQRLAVQAVTCHYGLRLAELEALMIPAIL
jgi:hypothetical protein